MKLAILAILTSGLFSTAYVEDKALLYEVSGKGLAQPSYLYGTFHLVCPNDLQLTEATRKTLASSKQLYLEIDFDDPALQINMIKAMTLSGGKTLKDFLKPADYTALDMYMRRTLGVGLEQMDTLKPIALLSAMYVSVLKCQPASYDLTFAELAGQAGKEVLGLETLEQQIALLDRVPLEEQGKGLIEMVQKPDEALKEITSLMAAYKAQDLDQLMKLIRESRFDGEAEGFKEELLDKRNSNWIPVIEKAARDKSTFFAFGAGHLGGANGVISLLRQKGYTVKAVK